MTAKGVDRDKLTSLLSQIDSQENISSLNRLYDLSALGSFIERTHSTGWSRSRSGGGGRPPPEPARRRNHTPCECPDFIGDQMAANCITERMNYLGSQYEESFTVKSTGDSIESGRLNIRDKAETLRYTFDVVHDQAVAIRTNISDRTDGYQASVDRMSQTILNEEYLMAQSANSAWMNLIANTDTTAGLLTNASSEIMKTASEVAQWFNGLQNQEEALTYGNIVRLVNLANQQMKVHVDEMNKVKRAVTTSFSALETNLGGSEAKTSSLADTLTNAGEKLSQNIDTFQQDIPNAGLNADNRLTVNLANQLNKYQSSANAAVTGFSNSAAGKKETFRTTSSKQITAQADSARQMYYSSTNLVQKTMSDISGKQQIFGSISGKSYGDVISSIDLLSSTHSQNFTSKAQKIRDKLSAKEDARSNIDSLIKGYLNDESKSVADSSTAETNRKTEATNIVNDLLTSSTSKQSSVQTSASTVASGAVEGVGTNGRSSLDKLGSQYDSSLVDMSTQGKSAASAAATASNRLNKAATGGSNAVDTAQQTVLNGVQRAFSDVLYTMNTLPGGISDSAASSLDMKAVLSTAKTDKARAADMIKSALYGGQSISLDQQSATEKAIEGLLQRIDFAYPAMKAVSASVSQSISTGSSVSQGVQTGATQAGQEASSTVAGAASQVAMSEDAFAKNLNDMLNAMIKSGPVGMGQVTGGVVDSSRAASDIVQDAKSQIDAQGEKIEGGQRDAQQATDGAAEDIKTTGENVQKGFQASSGAVADHIDDSLGDISSLLSQSTSGAAMEVESHLHDIESSKDTIALQVGKIDTNQMEQIRAVASTVDAVMQQINAFLSASSPKLFEELQTLPYKSQGLFMRMQALRTQVDNLRANFVQGGSDKDIDGMIRAVGSKLRLSNATAADAVARVGSEFNISADYVMSQNTEDVSAALKEFSDTSTALKDQLAKIGEGIKDAEVALVDVPGSESLVSKLQDMQSAIYGLSSTSMERLLGVNGNNVGGAPENIKDVFRQLALIQGMAGKDAAFADSTLWDLSQLSGSYLEETDSFARGPGAVHQAEIEREAQLAAMSENIAQEQLAQRQKVLGQMNADQAELLTGYADDVRAQTNYANNKASTVYDTVVKARADASGILGRIAAKYATANAALQSGMRADTSAESAQIVSLHDQLTTLLTLFDQYINTARYSFTQAEAGSDTFVRTTLLKVTNDLNRIDNELMSKSRELAGQVSRVAQKLEGIKDADIDTALDALKQQFATWSDSQLNQAQEEVASLKNITMAAQTNYNLYSIQQALTSAVNYVANQARSLLQVAGKDTAPVDTLVSSFLSSTPAPRR